MYYHVDTMWRAVIGQFGLIFSSKSQMSIEAVDGEDNSKQAEESLSILLIFCDTHIQQRHFHFKLWLPLSIAVSETT